MAIALIQELSEATVDNYDQINARMDVNNNPPDGLIVHTAGEKEGGGVRIVDVWESLDHYNRFREERLMEAVTAVMGEPTGPPEMTTYELHNVLIP